MMRAKKLSSRAARPRRAAFFLFALAGVLALVSCDGRGIATPAPAPGPPDVTPPAIEEVSPANGAAGLPVATTVSFHVKDSGAGVDKTAISVRINGQDVPVDVSGNSSDYLVRCRPETGFRYGESVSVTIEARDLAPVANQVRFGFGFSIMADTASPYITDVSPGNGAADVPHDAAISFHLKDNASGVDRASIILKIDGKAVAPTISGNGSDYLVEYRPDDGFSYGAQVNVAVSARDLAYVPNGMAYAFAFSVEKDSRYPPAVDAANNIRLDIIYYGQHTPEVNSLILSVDPQYLIGNPAHGLWGEAYGYGTWWLLHDVSGFQKAGIKVIGYLTSGYEGTGSGSGIELKWYTLEMNKKLITNMAQQDGVDGVFIDECSSFPGAASKEYLKELSDLAHSLGLVVWGNVGHDEFDEWYFTEGGFDMMNASEDWRGQALTPVQQRWASRISVTGFNSGYTAADAYRLTRDAWDKGLAYAYISNDEYAAVPSWIKQLADMIRSGQ